MASSPGRLNPYKMGIELFRDIEERWNKGQFGKEYEECDDLAAKRKWDTGAGLGRQKIFEVRKIHNDLTFIDTFLTLDFCRQHKLFSFGYNPGTDYYEIESREFPKIKQRLLFSLTNRGQPMISVRDGNYKNRGELYLEHDFNGVELQTGYARDTLTNLYRLWTRPVHIETTLEGVKTVLSFDGFGAYFRTKQVLESVELEEQGLGGRPMALVDQVKAALAGLASPTQAPQQLAVQDADTSFQCQIAGLDSLGCAFTEFELTIGKLSAAPIDQLKRVAEALQRGSLTCSSRFTRSKSTATSASCKCGRRRLRRTTMAPAITNCWSLVAVA